MKKLLSLLLCLSMLCMTASALAYTPGSYTASGNGLMGPVEVTVTFDEAAITEIVVGAHTETAGICDAAIEKVPAAIIAGQTVAVDVASGATFTSQAIIDAVADCVAQAGGDVAAMQSAGASAAMAGVGDGPYYAVRVRPATIGTMGGVKIDLDMHVLKADGTAIPGLYAAGACANGDFFYKEYPASGTSIQMCFTTGRIAGTNAAAGK